MTTTIACIGIVLEGMILVVLLANMMDLFETRKKTLKENKRLRKYIEHDTEQIRALFVENMDLHKQLAETKVAKEKAEKLCNNYKLAAKCKESYVLRIEELQEENARLCRVIDKVAFEYREACNEANPNGGASSL